MKVVIDKHKYGKTFEVIKQFEQMFVLIKTMHDQYQDRTEKYDLDGKLIGYDIDKLKGYEQHYYNAAKNILNNLKDEENTL